MASGPAGAAGLAGRAECGAGAGLRSSLPPHATSASTTATLRGVRTTAIYRAGGVVLSHDRGANRHDLGIAPQSFELIERT